MSEPGPGGRVCGTCAFLNYGPHAACLNCGTELGPRPPLGGTVLVPDPAPSPVPTCPTCASAIRADQRFCGVCGTGLG
jgi:hypothetical protein